jgi:hypothetical protein
VLTTTASSLYKKTFSSKSNATILENGTHLNFFGEVYLIHKLRKHLLHEVIPSFLDSIIAFLILGI